MFLKALVVVVVVAVAAQEEDTPGFELKTLPYSFDALEPAIDKQTMELHWGKHHRTYTDNMNTALNTLRSSPMVSKKLRSAVSAALKTKDVDMLESAIHLAVKEEQTAKEEKSALRSLRNNGGGYLNHNQYWTNLSPAKRNDDIDDKNALVEEIEKTFHSLQDFKDTFVQQGLGVFGSGWVWLAYNTANKQLEIVTSPNQDRLAVNYKVVLACDVWEHAYYLKRQNVRADYLKAFFSVVNMKEANARYLAAKHAQPCDKQDDVIKAEMS